MQPDFVSTNSKKDHLEVNSKKVTINSHFQWVISESHIFNRKIENKNHAKTIIQDIYSACLSNVLKSYENNIHNQINELEKNMLIECNNKKLSKFGIEIKDIHLVLKK
jgi:hypothetical protein